MRDFDNWTYLLRLSLAFFPLFCLFVCFSISLRGFALESEITWSVASFSIAGLLTPWQNKMYYNNNVFNYLWIYCFERSSCLFCWWKIILLCPESVRLFIIQQQRIVQYGALLLCKLERSTNTLSYSACILITDQQNITLCWQGSSGCFVFRRCVCIQFVCVFGGLLTLRCVSAMRQAKVELKLVQCWW